jgi:hypothetical protein
MPNLPSVAHSYKHLILLHWSPLLVLHSPDNTSTAIYANSI